MDFADHVFLNKLLPEEFGKLAYKEEGEGHLGKIGLNLDGVPPLRPFGAIGQPIGGPPSRYGVARERLSRGDFREEVLPHVRAQKYSVVYQPVRATSR